MTKLSDHHFKSRTVFLLLCFGFVTVVVLRLILAFSYVPETGGYSINVLYGIVRMLSGRGLYSNPELPPYPVIQYMPLHYYIVAGVSQLLGAGQSIHAIAVMNRILCLFFNLLLIFPIQRILRNIFDIQSRDLRWTVFFGIFLLLPATDYAGPGSFYLLTLLFSIYYFLCYLNLYDQKYGSELVLSAIFAALATFTNQLGFISLAGTLLFLIIYIRDPKATVRFAISAGVACLFLFIILIGSAYHYWFLNLFKGLAYLGNFNMAANFFSSSIFQHIYLFPVAGLVASLLIMTNLKIREKFLHFMSLCILLPALTNGLVFGSGENCLTGGFALVLFLLAIYYSNQHKWQPGTGLSMAFIVSIFLVNIYNNKSWELLKNLKHWEPDYTDCSIVSRYVKQNVKNDEYIFTAFHEENMMNVMIGEKALFPTRDIVSADTYPNKIFNYSDFTQRVKDGKIKYLLGKHALQPDKYLDAIFEGYEKEATIRGYDIYILKNSR